MQLGVVSCLPRVQNSTHLSKTDVTPIARDWLKNRHAKTQQQKDKQLDPKMGKESE